jgi:hypothetical protein
MASQSQWEIFRREPNGDFVYLETGELPSTCCLEFCRSKEYLETGRCTWQRGWGRNDCTVALPGPLRCVPDTVDPCGPTGR